MLCVVDGIFEFNGCVGSLCAAAKNDCKALCSHSARRIVRGNLQVSGVRSNEYGSSPDDVQRDT